MPDNLQEKELPARVYNELNAYQQIFKKMVILSEEQD